MLMSTNGDSGGDNYRWAPLLISQARLSPYLKSNKDIGSALNYYSNDLQKTADLYQWLSFFEVTLRNALFGCLSEIGKGSGDDFDPFTHIWPDLTPQGRGELSLAIKSILNRGIPVSPDRIVSELHFGFWRFLLASRYESTLWTQHLRHGFTNLKPQSRSVAYDAIESINTIRNRVAHHKTLKGKSIEREVELIKEVLGWISIDALNWAESQLPHAN